MQGAVLGSLASHFECQHLPVLGHFGSMWEAELSLQTRPAWRWTSRSLEELRTSSDAVSLSLSRLADCSNERF